MRRRDFLRTCNFTLCAAAAGSHAFAGEKSEIAEAFDREVEEFMQARSVPAGALAVAKGGRLVYAKGYGLADRESGEVVTNDSLFRIASISKPITAVAVLQLVESGRLALDANPFDLLGFEVGKAADPRLAKVTILHLLQHTGGWDRDKSFDPMFRAVQIARALDLPPPAQPAAVIRYMFDRKLETDPGTAYAYSNFGYCVLGRVIEKITGQTYEEYVKAKVLAPAGIRQMRIGATLAAGRAPNEVRYYMADGGNGRNVFDEAGERVPYPYGGFHLEAMDAHGGWIASAIDLVRFASALDDRAHSPLLKPESFDTMYAPPAAPVARDSKGSIAPRYYGCGWDVRPIGTDGRGNYWHTGSLPGTATLLVRRHDGLSWAICFNQRSHDRKLPDGAIDPALHRAANRVKTWPEGSALLT